MARKEPEIQPEELKGPDRVFQIDRDTLIIYTGLSREDMRPFMRYGAGMTVPSGILGNIENVVLPEEDLWNMGLEMGWMDATLQEAHDRFRYFGSREKVGQVHRYADLEDQHKEEQSEQVEFESYVAPLKDVSLREKSVVTYYATGNFVVNAGGSKVLDSGSFFRQKLTIDKEYDQISKALQKRARKCEEGMSFMLIESETDRFSIYWNLQGNGLFVNPPANYHLKLFENAIDPANVNMSIGASPYQPGFVEVLRRKNIEEGEVGLACPSAEHLTLLKRMYNKATLKLFDDARQLPFAKDVTYYISKARTHGLLESKMSGNTDQPVRILFPLGGGKEGRNEKSFEFTGGPFDLEFVAVNQKADIAANPETKDSLKSQLRLIHQGAISDRAYLGASLPAGTFPLRPGTEYKFAYAGNIGEALPFLYTPLKETAYEESFQRLLVLSSQPDLDEKDVQAILNDVRRQKLVEDMVDRSNIAESFRSLIEVTGIKARVSEKVAALCDSTVNRLSGRSKVRDWTEYNGSVECNIVFLGGRHTAFFVRHIEPEPILLTLPPAVEDIEENKKEFDQFLRRQGKVLDKLMDPPGYRQCLEFIEKLSEERLRLAGERKRLMNLLQTLGILGDPEAKSTSAFDRWPDWLRRPVEFLRIPQAIAWIKARFSGGSGEQTSRSNRSERQSSSSGGGFREGSRAYLWLLIIPFLAILYFLFASFSGSDSGVDESARLDSESTQQESRGRRLWPFSRSNDDAPERLVPYYEAGDDHQSLPPVTEEGNSEQEIGAVALVEPGDVQDEAGVPGEADLEVTMREILEYSNALATSNGFATIDGNQEDLRNPDLVFPGDALRLPDGRIVSITPGESIWQVSSIHYRRDLARMMILDRQVDSLIEDYKKKRMKVS